MADVQQAAQTGSPLPGGPAEWPGAFGVYKYSKKAALLNLEALVILWFMTIAIDVICSIYQPAQVSNIVLQVLFAPILAAQTLAVIAGVRGQHLSLGEALGKGLAFWLKVIVLLIVLGLIAAASLLVFIIPFFFIMPRLSLSHYFLIDKKLGIIESVQASWNATKGSAGKVWGIIGATVLMVLLMITIIGIPFAFYFLFLYSAAFGVLYEFLNNSKPAAAPVPAAASPAPPAAPQAPAAPPTV